MFRRLIFPSSLAVSGVAVTYFASLAYQEQGSTGKKHSTKASSLSLANKDISNFERLSLSDVYTRYKIKTLDRKNKERILGEGSYAHVIGCTEVTTGKSVALKVVKKAFTKIPDFEREVSALTAARFHPNIVQLLDVIDVPDADSWLLVTELLEGGELFDRILQNGAFSERSAAELIRKVAWALSCLHKLGWAHNDVKPENLVYCTKSKDSEIKLIDFGMARRHPGSSPNAAEPKPVTRDLGTTAYWPPEVLNSKTRFTCDPRAIDAWTLGVLTYILLFGCHPFDRAGDASEEIMASRIALGTSGSKAYIDFDCFGPDVVSAGAKRFMKALFEEDPNKRMKVDEVLKHPWIMDMIMTAEEKQNEDKIASSPAKLRGERDAQAALAAVLKLATDSSASRDASFTLGRSSAYVSGGKARRVFFEDATLQSELDKRRLKRFEDVVYDVGDPTTGLYVLVSGKALLEYTSENGGHVAVQNLFPGDLFGETAILEGRSVRNVRVKAVPGSGPLEVYFFSRDDVVAVLSGSSELKEKLDDLSARRYRLRAANALVRKLEDNPRLGKSLFFKKGESIFTKGEPANHIYLIKSGVVKSVVGDPSAEGDDTSKSDTNVSSLERALGSSASSLTNKDRLVIGEWGPGDVFGISALYGSARFASAITQTPVQVIEVRREDLEHVLETEPMLRENLAQQFRTFKERSSSIARKYTTKRKSEITHKIVRKEDDEGAVVTLKKGDVLFKQGNNSSDGVFFVQEGEVHLVDAQGNVRHANKEGMTFGTESFVRKAPRKFTAVAATDAKLIRVKVRSLDEDDDQKP